MPGSDRKSDVDQYFAQIVGIPCSGEEPVLNHSFAQLQYKEFLRITDVVEEDAGNAKKWRESKDPVRRYCVLRNEQQHRWIKVHPEIL